MEMFSLNQIILRDFMLQIRRSRCVSSSQQCLKKVLQMKDHYILLGRHLIELVGIMRLCALLDITSAIYDNRHSHTAEVDPHDEVVIDGLALQKIKIGHLCA